MSASTHSRINEPRVQSLMDEYDIDVLVAATPENVAYVSDYSPWFHWAYRGTTTKKGRYETYALFPRDQEVPPALLLERLDVYQSQWPSWIPELYTWGSNPQFPDDGLDPQVETAPEVQRLTEFIAKATEVESGKDALITALTNKELESSVIALDTDGVPSSTQTALTAEFPDATILDAGEFFRYIRAVKSPTEIEILREAAKINEQAIMNVVDAIEVGVTERELAKLHRVTVTELGAIPDFFNIYAGKRAGTFWEPSDRPIQSGDIVFMDGGCIYEDYHADTGTCAVVDDTPSKEVRQRYQIMEAGLDAALHKVEAGEQCSALTTAMHEAILEAGGSEPFGFGHAIGIEARDMPLLLPPYDDFDDEILNGATDIPLETDMVINLEVPYWEWNLGALQKEHSVIVKPNGYEFLTHQERRLNTV